MRPDHFTTCIPGDIFIVITFAQGLGYHGDLPCPGILHHFQYKKLSCGDTSKNECDLNVLSDNLQGQKYLTDTLPAGASVTTSDPFNPQVKYLSS